MPLFKRRPVKPPLPPLESFTLDLVQDDNEFKGEDGSTVTARGFWVEHGPVELGHDEAHEVADRVYYFRVAGIVHHAAAAQSGAFEPLSRVALLREPGNKFDKNAIRVVGADGSHCGYVPAALAGPMAMMIDRAGLKGGDGIVTRTFAVRGGRNAIEVVGSVLREVQISATIDDGPDDEHEDGD